MTIAHKDFESHVTEALAVTPELQEQATVAKVMLVAQTASLAQVLAEEMAQDAGVSGELVTGTLSSALLSHADRIDKTDLIVFEICDEMSDLAAVRGFQQLPVPMYQFIAVTREAISPDMTERFAAAGVGELISVKSPDAQPLAPKPDATEAAPEAAAFCAPQTAPEPIFLLSSEHAKANSAAEVTSVPETLAEAKDSKFLPKPVIESLISQVVTPVVEPADEAGATVTTDVVAQPAPIDQEEFPESDAPACIPAQADQATEVATVAPAAEEAVTEEQSAPEVAADAGGDATVIMRARGGAGATTLAVNLAIGQAKRSAEGKVALLDLDIQNGAVALQLDLPDSAEATGLITGALRADAGFLDAAMQRHSSGLDVLTAPDMFAPLSAITPAMVSELITVLRMRYDHVIIDMPQTMVEWSNAVFENATKLVLVSDMTLPSLKRSKRLIDLISEEHMTLPIRIVLNFEKRPMMKSAAHKEAENLIGRPLEHWIPADAKAARFAVDMGKPLALSAKRSAASKAITALGKDMFKTSGKE